MFNLEILQMKTTKNTIKMAIYSRSFVQNFDNWWSLFKKNKRIA